MSDSRKGAENRTNPQESLRMFIPDILHKSVVESTNTDIAIFYDFLLFEIIQIEWLTQGLFASKNSFFGSL